MSDHGAPPMEQHDQLIAFLKISLAWFGFLGTIVLKELLQDIALILTIIFTSLQIYALWKWKIRRKIDEETE